MFAVPDPVIHVFGQGLGLESLERHDQAEVRDLPLQAVVDARDDGLMALGDVVRQSLEALLAQHPVFIDEDRHVHWQWQDCVEQPPQPAGMGRPVVSREAVLLEAVALVRLESCKHLIPLSGRRFMHISWRDYSLPILGGICRPRSTDSTGAVAVTSKPSLLRTTA